MSICVTDWCLHWTCLAKFWLCSFTGRKSKPCLRLPMSKIWNILIQPFKKATFYPLASFWVSVEEALHISTSILEQDVSLIGALIACAWWNLTHCALALERKSKPCLRLFVLNLKYFDSTCQKSYLLLYGNRHTMIHNVQLWVFNSGL